MNVKFEAPDGAVQAAMDGAEQRLAVAATETITEAAELAKVRVRANIASAGFGLRWQNAFKVSVYPKGKPSLGAAAFLVHKIPYANVFETGATILGKPMLWIPLSSTPKMIGTQRLTPKTFNQEVGKLVLIKRPGRRPLLAARVSSAGSSTVSALKRASRSKGKTTLKPMFIGIDAVSIRKRFDILETVDTVRSAVPDIFAKHLKAE
jgi:hypothetical protein